METTFEFPKTERLRSKSLIEEVFEAKQSFKSYPYVVFWKEISSEIPVQVLFSVPKKRIRKATKRNLIRRRIKEAYRLNKSGLHLGAQKAEKQLAVIVLFIGHEGLDYQTLEKKLIVSLNQLQQQIATQEKDL